MRNLILLLLVLLFTKAEAQWTNLGWSIYYASGNVGIGTSSPTTSTLHINSTNTSGLRIQNITGGSGTKAGIDFSTNTGTGRVARIETIDQGSFNGDLAFLTDGDNTDNSNTTEKMRITKMGNVGIGNSAPLNGLHVYRFNDFNGGSLRFGHSGSYDGVISMGYNTSAARDAIKFSYFPHNSTTGQADIMVLDVNGNVGIGTANPNAKLEVTNGGTLGTTGSNQTYLLLQRASSYVNTNYFMNNLWVYRFKDGNNWTSTALHDGLSVDGSFQLPGTNGDSRVWWERRPADVTQRWGDGNITHMALLGANAGTGVTTTTLSVNGIVTSKEVNVQVNVPGPDYVFEKDYTLPSLESIKTYVDQNKHLPEVPSAKEMEANGINLSEMNMLLLKKVEELTLYVIEQQKEIDGLKSKIK
jgi:hypothetical protein